MRVLIAEDDLDVASSYLKALGKSNHEVVISSDGEDCLKTYRSNIEKAAKVSNNDSAPSSSTFDAVILDYRMPKKDGIEVAKEILELNPNQRIIFASAYVKETLEDAVKELKRVVELMQKPFDADALVDTIEDKEVYENLKDLMKSVRKIQEAQPTQKQIKDLFESLKKIQKGRTF
jgi:CheY-like chemotaxis protein